MRYLIGAWCQRIGDGENVICVVWVRAVVAVRKLIDDRKVLSGILFVLKTGISWEDLPAEMSCGSSMTC